MAVEVQESREYPLYDTTFTVHRLSPLFHSAVVLDAPTLTHHASAFRDLLAGEVLRGVRVGLTSNGNVLSRVGSLQTVRWTILGTEEDWHSHKKTSGNDTTTSETNRRGIFVEVAYERGAYVAILLRNSSAQEEAGSSNYPLLLTKMPGALRETFLDFLATTFDTRPSAIKLPSSFITATVEKYLENITSSEDGPLEAVWADKALRTITKDILVTLSFDIPGRNSLRSIDVALSKDDTSRMMLRGRKLQEVSGNGTSAGPFLTALRQYLLSHLALDMGQSHVSVSRIACGAFVISAEGKLKVIAPLNGSDSDSPHAKATNRLVNSLVGLAKGGKLADAGLP